MTPRDTRDRFRRTHDRIGRGNRENERGRYTSHRALIFPSDLGKTGFVSRTCSITFPHPTPYVFAISYVKSFESLYLRILESLGRWLSPLRHWLSTTGKLNRFLFYLTIVGWKLAVERNVPMMPIARGLVTSGTVPPAVCVSRRFSFGIEFFRLCSFNLSATDQNRVTCRASRYHCIIVPRHSFRVCIFFVVVTF